MANIHGVNSLRQNLLGGPDPTSAMLLQGNPIGTAAEARSETFFSMLKSFFSPFFNKYSIASYFCGIITILFIITCIYQSERGKFLVPTEASLIFFGARKNEKLKHLQIWRWITPVFLHANFQHIFINLIFIFAFAPRIEVGVGRRVCILICFMTAFAGNLAGALFSNDTAVGSSTAIFGMIGCNVGWIVANWEALSGNQARNVAIVILIVITCFNLLVGVFGHGIDHMGHIGGFVVGFLCAFAMIPRLGRTTEWDQKQNWGARVSIGVYFVGGLLFFYLR